MLALVLLSLVVIVYASSHSEAPGTARGPNTDLTDFYFFNSPTPGHVVLVMNVAGLIQSQAGPNYNPINNDHVYQIHVDNDGDAYEDYTFQFITGYRYVNNGRGIEAPVNGKLVPIPLSHVVLNNNPIAYNAADGTTTGLNAEEYYRVRLLKGDDYSDPIEDGPFLSTVGFDGRKTREFTKAYDNAGEKSFNDTFPSTAKYDAYVKSAAIYSGVEVPGCHAGAATLFVGPRRESFGIALGEVFDAVNIDPAPAFNLANRSHPETTYDGNSIDRFSVISFVLELPTACLLNKHGDPVLGAWASVRKLEHRADDRDHHHEKRDEHDDDDHETKHYAGEQTTRLANALVNELIIGTTYKNEWNARSPSGDERFNDFLLFPVVPFYLNNLFGVSQPSFPRVDILAVFHTGVPGLNQLIRRSDDDDDHHDDHHDHHDHKRDVEDDDDAPVFADLLRLNTGTPFTPFASQNALGVIGHDFGGYPNGRRLGDDVVDITLRVAEGVLCLLDPVNFCGIPTASRADLANAGLLYTDQAPVRACMFPETFPYLNPPISGNKLLQPSVQSQWQANCAPYTGNNAFSL